MSLYNFILGLSFEHKRIAYYISNKINIDNKKIIDVGGGSGLLSKYLLHYGAKDVLNIDSSMKMLQKSDMNIETECIGVFNLNRLDKKFDIAICYDSLHHFANGTDKKELVINKAINEMLFICKEKLIIVDINPNTIRGYLLKVLENKIFMQGSFFITENFIKKNFSDVNVEYKKHGKYNVFVFSK